MKKISILIVFLLFIGFVTLPSAARSEKEDGLFLAASNGNGTLFLVWYVPVENWPENGWRLVDDTGKVLLDHILPLPEDAMAKLPADQADAVKNFLKTIPEVNSADKKDREMFNGFLAINVFSSFETAKALGFAHQLIRVPPGKRTYEMISLDKNGKPKGIRLLSDRIDSAAATPLPPVPGNLKAAPALEGAQIFWRPAPDNPKLPVLSYAIERVSKDKDLSETFEVTKGISWDKEFPAFTDTAAPVEQELTYRVYSVDAFGRKSLPAVVSLFMPDMMTLMAPVNLSAVSKQEKVVVSWELSDRSNPAGFVVERSSGPKGAYEPLTLKGLENKVRSFTDATVMAGIFYYYRVRSIGTDGTLGEPSSPVSVQVKSTKSLPPPHGLTAKTNSILVTLNWEKKEAPIAGYIVEKRAKGSDRWARLNDGLLKLRTHKDRFPPESYGIFYYRVTAVGFDNQQSKPSKELEVTLEDLSLPLKPVVTSIDGSNGKVRLFFEPNKLDRKIKTFTILRDLPSRKEGDIIKQGISVKEKLFEDDDVVPGQGYWYAVVAVDEKGRESEWSKKHLVRVVAPGVPKAKKPKAEFARTPFAHVTIQFDAPPEKMLVSLQRQDREDAPWNTLNKGMTGTDTMDTNPVASGISWYRIVYHSINGMEGEPSEAVEVKQ